MSSKLRYRAQFLTPHPELCPSPSSAERGSMVSMIYCYYHPEPEGAIHQDFKNTCQKVSKNVSFSGPCGLVLALKHEWSQQWWSESVTNRPFISSSFLGGTSGKCCSSPFSNVRRVLEWQSHLSIRLWKEIQHDMNQTSCHMLLTGGLFISFALGMSFSPRKINKPLLFF